MVLESWEEKWLKADKPDVKGCMIQNVCNATETGWIAYYPGGSEKSRSRYYGKNGVTSEAAAKHVFTWAWLSHRASSGKPIPEDFAVHLDLIGFGVSL